MVGCEYRGVEFCSVLTSSSELREEVDVGLRGGELELFGALEPRHCAAWEGTVTVVIVLATFVFWRAILRRLARLELCESCELETVREVIAYISSAVHRYKRLCR